MTKENLIDDLVDFGFKKNFADEYVYTGKHISIVVEPLDRFVYVYTYISTKAYKGVASNVNFALDDLHYMIVNEMPYDSAEVNFYFKDGTFHKYIAK